MSQETGDRSHKPGDGFFNKIRLPLTFGLVTLLAVGIYYYFFVQRKYNYLTGRDFRFLASIGAQLESALQVRGRMLENLATQDDLEVALKDPDKKRKWIDDYAPGFENIASVEHRWPGIKAADSLVLALKRAAGATSVEIFHAAKRDSKEFPIQGSLKLQTVADPFFIPRQAFDAVLLANAQGEVVYFQGARDLSVTHLGKLLDKGITQRSRGKEERSIGTFLPSSSESYAVALNSREYRLFVEPLSLPLRSYEDLQTPGKQVEQETIWLICGLVPKKEFVYKSLAVSSVLLSSLLGLLILTALSWPFLKLILIGDMQRVGIVDAILLGVCTVMGISIITLFLLQGGFFADLKSTAKAQLAELAARMQRNVTSEIQAAYPVLKNMEGRAVAAMAGKAELLQTDLLQLHSKEVRKYPLAQTFMLVRQDGKQVYKASYNQTVPPLILVRSRAYFRRALNGDTWDLKALEDGDGPSSPFYIEPIWGWTNGTRAAMMSKPVDAKHLSGESGPRVAGLAIPMVSLVDPVLPQGFKFAVIDNEDDVGRVLFHSDSERNLTENFLTETDQDRRLRSTVFARRTETMTVRYWGDDYLARVSPVPGLPWTIVVLKDMKTLRAVNVALISTTLLLLLLYTGALAVFLLAAVSIRPSYRAEWLWPDPQRRSEYHLLGIAFLFMLGGFSLAVWGMRGSSKLVTVSFILPLLAIFMAYLKLQRKSHGQRTALGISLLPLLFFGSNLFAAPFDTRLRLLLQCAILLLVIAGWLLAAGMIPRRGAGSEPKTQVADKGWKSVAGPYCFAGVVFLLLITVLPTAGFFKVAHHIHSISFLRHGQLKLAQELKKWVSRANQMVAKVSEAMTADDMTKDCLLKRRLAVAGTRLEAPCQLDDLKLMGLDIYAGAFHATHVELAPGRKSRGKACECVRHDEAEILPGFLEDLLPRASEVTAEMREMLHSRASDCAWHWEEENLDRSIFHSHDYPGGEIHLSSAWNQSSPESQSGGQARLSSLAITPSGLVNALPLAGLLLVITLLAMFIARRIFLIDLLEPLWSEKEDTGPATIGRNLFLVGRSRNWTEEVRQKFFCIHFKDLEDQGWPERWSALLESKQVILVEGFEMRMRHPEFNQKKLVLLEELVGMQERTVVVTSTVSPALLFSREARNGNGASSGLGSPSLEQRWRNLLSFFTIHEEDLQGVLERVEASSKIESEVLKAECGINSHLLPIAEQLDQQVSHFSREQILEEFGERAEGYYHALWASCSSEEQVVLEHLAEEGLVNEKSRRVLRRLMARGFVRRAPNFRLMNETFRRFVASSTCRSEVRDIEKQAAPSTWDRLRLPLFTGLAASIGFLLATQQELLDGLLASVTGFTAGIPAIVKLFDFFGGARSELPRPGGQK